MRDSKKKVLLQDEFIPLLTNIEILPWDRQTSQTFGEIKAGLRQAGHSAADLDVAIAAHALSHECVLVTDNFSDFEPISGLELVNWKAASR